LQALERAGLPYRVTCTVRGVLGVVAAARAGLGVAIFARSLVPDDLIELPASAGLPDVGAIDLVLLTNPRSATEPAEALTAAILASATRQKPPGLNRKAERAALELAGQGTAGTRPSR